MKLTTENLIKFFENKLDELDRIDIEDDDAVELWWDSVKTCGEHMGKAYSQKLGNPTFCSDFYVSGMDIERADHNAKVADLRSSRKNIRKILNELEQFGFQTSTVDEATMPRQILNINQTQNAKIAIKISDFDLETQKNIHDLQTELSKRKKNKDTIKKILVKLGETSIDVLEKIFLHSIDMGE